MAQPRKRRRATRLSDAPNYDRTADRPPFQSAFGPDGERAVPVDDEAAAAGEELTGEEFYRAQQPPHYGA